MNCSSGLSFAVGTSFPPPRHPPAPIEPKAWGGKMPLCQKHPEATTPRPPKGGGLGVVAGAVARRAAVTIFANEMSRQLNNIGRDRTRLGTGDLGLMEGTGFTFAHPNVAKVVLRSRPDLWEICDRICRKMQNCRLSSKTSQYAARNTAIRRLCLT